METVDDNATLSHYPSTGALVTDGDDSNNAELLNFCFLCSRQFFHEGLENFDIGVKKDEEILENFFEELGPVDRALLDCCPSCKTVCKTLISTKEALSCLIDEIFDMLHESRNFSFLATKNQVVTRLFEPRPSNICETSSNYLQNFPKDISNVSSNSVNNVSVTSFPSQFDLRLDSISNDSLSLNLSHNNPTLSSSSTIIGMNKKPVLKKGRSSFKHKLSSNIETGAEGETNSNSGFSSIFHEKINSIINSVSDNACDVSEIGISVNQQESREIMNHFRAPLPLPERSPLIDRLGENETTFSSNGLKHPAVVEVIPEARKNEVTQEPEPPLSQVVSTKVNPVRINHTSETSKPEEVKNAPTTPVTYGDHSAKLPVENVTVPTTLFQVPEPVKATPKQKRNEFESKMNGSPMLVLKMPTKLNRNKNERRTKYGKNMVKTKARKNFQTIAQSPSTKKAKMRNKYVTTIHKDINKSEENLTTERNFKVTPTTFKNTMKKIAVRKRETEPILVNPVVSSANEGNDEEILKENNDIVPQITKMLEPIKSKLNGKDSEKDFYCEKCNRFFKQKRYLNAHSRARHGSTEGRKFICNVCGTGYKLKKGLEYHIAACHRESPRFKCDICEKIFTQKSGLQRHLDIHTGNHQFQCDHCGKQFIHRTSLKAHLQIHEGTKEIQCPQCDLKFAHKSHLFRHLKIHTGEKNHKCPVCDKSFSERYNLTTHLKSHGQNRNHYDCPCCAKPFARKYNMKLHMKSKHGSESLTFKINSNKSKSNNNKNSQYLIC